MFGGGDSNPADSEFAAFGMSPPPVESNVFAVDSRVWNCLQRFFQWRRQLRFAGLGDAVGFDWGVLYAFARARRFTAARLQWWERCFAVIEAEMIACFTERAERKKDSGGGRG